MEQRKQKKKKKKEKLQKALDTNELNSNVKLETILFPHRINVTKMSYSRFYEVENYSGTSKKHTLFFFIPLSASNNSCFAKEQPVLEMTNNNVC